MRVHLVVAVTAGPMVKKGWALGGTSSPLFHTIAPTPETRGTRDARAAVPSVPSVSSVVDPGESRPAPGHGGPNRPRSLQHRTRL